MIEINTERNVLDVSQIKAKGADMFNLITDLVADTQDNGMKQLPNAVVFTKRQFKDQMKFKGYDRPDLFDVYYTEHNVMEIEVK